MKRQHVFYPDKDISKTGRNLGAWIKGVRESSVNSITFAIQNGPVVQLNRMSDSGSEGHRFESCRGHLNNKQL